MFTPADTADLRTPVSARILARPFSGAEAILPVLSMSTAEGVRFVPNSGPVSNSESYRNCDLNLLLSALTSSASPEDTKTNRGAPFGGFSSHLLMSLEIAWQNGHFGSQKSRSVSLPNSSLLLTALPSRSGSENLGAGLPRLTRDSGLARLTSNCRVSILI